MITISEVSRLLRGRKISCRELTEKYLAEAERLNPSLGAYITLTPDPALAAADSYDRALASGETLSPLAGIPFVMKDNISTAGIKTTCGSQMLENFEPVYDAYVWKLLRGCGSVMLGKGNMDEFSMGSTSETSYFGGAKNPHDTRFVAGGSSGGVAAAVSGGTAVFGIGSDTGGGIRQPASFCGLVALKPTYGAVSRNGLIAYASSFDQIGPITSCTEDAALIFDMICLKDPMDLTSLGAEQVSKNISADVRGLKIGIAPEFFNDLPEEMRKPIDEAIEIYRTLGAEIVPVSFPSFKKSLPAYYTIVCAEASSNLGRFAGICFGYSTDKFDNLDEMISKTRGEGFGPEVRRRILLGTYVLSAEHLGTYFKSAQRIKENIRSEFDGILKKCDVLLAPVSPVRTIESEARLSSVETFMKDIYTVPASLAGVPAVSLPCGENSDGLPVGLQLMGRRFDEKTILSLSLAFEKATGARYLKSSGMGVCSL